MPPGISGSTSSTTRRLDHDRDVEGIPQRRASEAGRSASNSPIPTAAQEAYGLEAAKEAIANFNDRILYVGTNPESMKKEEDSLRARAAVESVRAKAGATVELDGKSYDLKNAAHIESYARAFATHHGLPAASAAALRDILHDAPPDGRDELAGIAMVWARGERGAVVPSRLVISGHHSGGQFTDLKDESVLALAHLFPDGAKQVEDIHFSGCFTEANVTDPAVWRGAFPNLRTMWGYSELSPKAPVEHLARGEST
jgi:hypothetical protein